MAQSGTPSDDGDVTTVVDSAAPKTDLDERTEALFERAAAACDDAERQRLLDEVVLLHLPTARAVAMRYRQRSEPVEDLVQVAALGLVKAARAFDPGRGTGFLGFAIPTVTGEVKRYFRDRGWAVRPPRRLQDLRMALNSATQQLTHELGRSPRPAELAERLGVAEHDVLETLVSLQHWSTTSLDAPVDGDDGPLLAETIGAPDASLETIDDLASIEPLLANLPERDRHILCLRFYQGWTQAQIAHDIGVTQMQVSRLLSNALRRLRASVLAEGAVAG